MEVYEEKKESRKQLQQTKDVNQLTTVFVFKNDMVHFTLWRLTWKSQKQNSKSFVLLCRYDDKCLCR